jgi:hypothetical protein
MSSIASVTSTSSTASSYSTQPQNRASASESADAAPKDSSTVGVSPQDQSRLNSLKSVDRSVRSHELAHLTVAGGLSRSGVSFVLQRGPDGQMYAVGGEVSIDVSAVPDDPQATLRKADIIRRAALAPMDPSPQDRAVAVQADRLAEQASREIATARLAAYSVSPSQTTNRIDQNV